tara:strand:- start:4508 stop:4870 length:363 start_codon:yes stop_codon:yes gene_type:complete
MKRTYHKTRRNRQRISDFLASCENETASFTEIQDYLNENFRYHAPTPPQLANIMAKDVEWERLPDAYHDMPLVGGGLRFPNGRWRTGRYKLTGEKRQLTATAKSSAVDWKKEGVRTFGGE